MPEDPKTWSNEAPPSALRAHWKLAALAAVAAVAIGYVLIAVFALKDSEQDAGMLGAVRNLEDLAAQLKQGKPEEVLARVNGPQLLAAAAEAVGATKAELSRGEYVAANGLSASFDVLDRDANGVLTGADFAAAGSVASGAPADHGRAVTHTAAPPEGQRVPRTDKRTGLELVLDPLRSSWLGEVEATDLAASYVFRGKSLPAADFGSGPYGTLVLRGGVDGVSGERIRCFITRDMVREKLRAIDAKGSIREFSYPRKGLGDVARFDGDPSAPETYWLEQVKRLSDRKGHSDAAAWAALALKLQAAGGMGEEAANAAKRALIYDPTLSELYPLLGVEYVDGVMRRKER